MAFVFGAALVLVPAADGVDDIETEETIAELLATPPRADDPTTRERSWAVLPQLGYGPETGPLVGGKFTHRDLFGTGVTFDVDGNAALEGQYGLSFELGSPHLADDRFLALLEVEFDLDPQEEFFGLGNNELGSDPEALSTHQDQSTSGQLTFGWRPWRQLALNASIGLRYVSIRRGERDGDIPRTVQRFPDLPGVDGGWVNPIALSLVWTTRDDVIRPTRGWRGILKVAHTNEALLSDYEFTRYSVDLGYLYPLFGGAHVIGARVNGAFIDGPDEEVPFWELTSLGGDDTLRGFFPERFLGTSRVLANAEYRFKLFDFDFFDIWHVRVGGAGFAELGRVFIDNDELEDEFEFDDELLDRVADFRFSYGGGLRFLLSQAIVARVDVGFSEEETALVYLQFGHTF